MKHIHEWLNLVVRWIHDHWDCLDRASFYFNWVEGQLNRRGPNPPGIAGDLWAVHGGILPLTEIPVARKLPEASLVQVGSLHDLGQWDGIAGHRLFLAGRILYGRSCDR